MSTEQAIAAINAEIQLQEQELKKLREELAAIEKAEIPADDQELLLSVLSCPHTVTHESITLRFNPKQEGYNALAQLRHRLAAADAAAKARELLLSVLRCPHTITHESITLRFNPKQAGYNALAQLRRRLAAADAAAKAREMELLAVIEDLERLIPLINRGGTP